MTLREEKKKLLANFDQTIGNIQTAFKVVKAFLA
jgi:hypothetical protein